MDNESVSLKRGGVYVIENVTNGKKYIGQSNNLTRRRNRHFSPSTLKYEINSCRGMYKDIKKLGKEKFTFKVLEFSDSKKRRTKIEEKFILSYDTTNSGYNIISSPSDPANRSIALIKKPVVMLDLAGNKLDEFTSVVEASIMTGLNKKSISKCCRGGLKTYKGYLWEFKASNSASNALCERDLPNIKEEKR